MKGKGVYIIGFVLITYFLVFHVGTEVNRAKLFTVLGAIYLVFRYSLYVYAQYLKAKIKPMQDNIKKLSTVLENAKQKLIEKQKIDKNKSNEL